VGQAADDQGLAPQRRIERLLHRREKGVDIRCRTEGVFTGTA
jgi:hypothetical protein